MSCALDCSHVGQSIQQADYVVPVEIEYHWHNVYVIKRPGVDNFLKKMGEIYEIVVFTASLSKVRCGVLPTNTSIDMNFTLSVRGSGPGQARRASCRFPQIIPGELLQPQRELCQGMPCHLLTCSALVLTCII